VARLLEIFHGFLGGGFHQGFFPSMDVLGDRVVEKTLNFWGL
jgi:hypothetical protein